MSAYATVEDVQGRMLNTMTEDQEAICENLLDDAAVMIDAVALNASADAKKVVSCRMVIRAMNVAEDVPVGASQGSMSALGYSQSWTMGTNASVGELYLSSQDKKTLGVGNAIGASDPLVYLEGRRCAE